MVMAKQIMVKVTLCDQEHGGPGNAARVYGHYNDTGACLRIGDTDEWVHTPIRLNKPPRPPKLDGNRDGVTFDPRRDADRLNKQMRAVWDVMKDGRWRIPAQMEQEIHAPWASISARLRDFRKDKFGGLDVERRYLDNGVWEYRLVIEESK